MGATAKEMEKQHQIAKLKSYGERRVEENMKVSRFIECDNSEVHQYL